jgi:hypothetical protein
LQYNGIVTVTKKIHLNAKELAYLRDAAMFHEKSGTVRERMCMKFPGRSFDATLIQRVMKKMQQDVANNLYPRCRLEHHPLCEKAKEQLVVAVSDPNHSTTVEEGSTTQYHMGLIAHEVHSSNYIPRNYEDRYSRLKEKFDEVARLAIASQDTYKQFTFILYSALNFFKSGDSLGQWHFPWSNSTGPLAQRNSSSASHNSTDPFMDMSPKISLPPSIRNDKKKRSSVSESEARKRAKFPKKKAKKQKIGKENIKSKQCMQL